MGEKGLYNAYIYRHTLSLYINTLSLCCYSFNFQVPYECVEVRVVFSFPKKGTAKIRKCGWDCPVHTSNAYTLNHINKGLCVNKL